jgi:hypothetical protein
MSTSLTQANIIQYVKVMLGFPVIDVELEKSQFEVIIEQVLGIYGTYKSVEKRSTISILSGQQNYDLTAAQVGKGIIDVNRPDPIGDDISLTDFDIFDYHTKFIPSLDPADFYAERLYYKEIKRSAGVDFDWEVVYDPDDGTAVLYISPEPDEAFTLDYIYVVDPSLTQIPASDDDFIKDYVLAMCKQVLGRILRKHKGVRGAEGQIELDGPELIQEGTEERRGLDEYLSNRGQVIPPIVG